MSSTRRDFLKAAVGGLFAASFLGSRNAGAVFMGPEQKREELFMNHDDLLTQPVHNHTQAKVDKKGQHYIDVSLEPYDYKKGDEKIPIEYYPVAQAGVLPPLMMLPMLGGISFVERGLARYYSAQGFPVLIVGIQEAYRHAVKDALLSVNRVEDVPRLTDSFNEISRSALQDVMRVCDWIDDRPELDGERIGAVGISLGAILLAAVMGVYAEKQRIKAGATIMGGAGLHTIIAHSKEPGIKRDRTTLLKAINRDQNWLEEQLYGEFLWDPMHHAHNIDPETILMFVAKGDTYVPTETGLDLAAAIGGSAQVEMVSTVTRHLPVIDGHLAAYFKRGKVQRRALAFFESRLKN